jgi:hypothetical protein
MKKFNFTKNEQSVLEAVQKKPLTSFQILKRVKKVPLILSLYNIMDKLKSKGALKSFFKKDVKYHQSIKHDNY